MPLNAVAIVLGTKFVVMILIAISLSGCASVQQAERTYPASALPSGYATEPSIAGSELPAERLVEYTAAIRMNTDVPGSLFRRILDLTTTVQGYVLRSDNTSITVRVPSEHFASFIDSVSGLGDVAAQEVVGVDVTEEYYDLQTRLDNAQRTRQRYLELLAQAQTVDQALAIEKELERVNRDIDLLTGRMNKHKHLATYATVTVTTAKPVRPGPVGYVFAGLYQAVKWLFVWD